MSLSKQTEAAPKNIPEDIELDLTFPEMGSTTLFDSPRELFMSTLKGFSKMLRRLRQSGSQSRQRSFRRRKVATRMAGRQLRLVGYRPGFNQLAPYATVLYSLFRNGSSGMRLPIKVSEQDFMGWEKQVQESLTLVLAIDVSRSTLAFKDMFAEIIKNLSAHFNRHRDRIGLISVCGNQAEIFNHPSRNHRVIAKSILQLEIKGETPLGDGLIKSLEMVKMQQTKNPGSKPVVILLSDCFPEPITHKYDQILDEPMYRHAITASEYFKKRQVSLIVINPSYRDENYITITAGKFKKTPGERLCDIIIKRSGGRLIKLNTSSTYSTSHFSAKSHGTHVIHQNKQIKEILQSIEDTFTGRQNFGMQSNY